jgi:hypothetical protein
MSSGFTKTFRLIALALLLSVMQVYVLAHPATTSTSAMKNTSAISNPVVTGHQLNFINQKQVASQRAATENATTQAPLASEHAIRLAPKSPLSLAFTKSSVVQAATHSAFLKVKKGTYDFMMSPKGQPVRGAADEGDNSEGDRKALYIASAIIIGAAVALFIGFHHDRDNDNIRGQ